MATGLGIIIGSNIFNIAIILSVATFAVPKKQGIVLTTIEGQDVRIVGRYALSIMCAILVLVWLLPGTPLSNTLQLPPASLFLLIATALLTLGIAGLLTRHALKHEPALSHEEYAHATIALPPAGSLARKTLVRWLVEMLLALAITLAGVVVMVQSGQIVTRLLHIPPVVEGLLILAVATSLPNLVVAFLLARANQESACVEEVFSSNSINATLGIALPLLFWHTALSSSLLLLLDTPLMIVLTLIALICVHRQQVGRLVAVALLLSYGIWVAVHMVV